MSGWIDDKLPCLVGALEKIADFSKVCIGPGCPYCEAEGDLEPLHPATWEAKAAQAALENAGIRLSTNDSSGAIRPRREETMSTSSIKPDKKRQRDARKSDADCLRIPLPHPDTVLLGEAVCILERCLDCYEPGGTMPDRSRISAFLRRANN